MVAAQTTPTAETDGAIIEVRGVTKRYGGVEALCGVDLLRHALIGQGFFRAPLAAGALVALTAVLLWTSVRVFSRGEDAETGGHPHARWLLPSRR